jgi:hypothetical protein
LYFHVISVCLAQIRPTKFSVLAFYTAKDKNEQAHITFVHEANQWFAKMAEIHQFTYESTDDWNRLNKKVLSKYQVVIFLDTRPDSLAQRKAFQKFIGKGGAWMGFHFAGFALTPSDFPQNWDWYHDQFLGVGQYKGNTWRPTSAILRVEASDHPSTKNLPQTFSSAPNEWYSWEKDLRTKSDIKILLSIDSTSFPLGTGPKQHEIWKSGYYPVAWTNTKYRMIYMNMGHNDIDYENGTNKILSLTFGNKNQDRFIIDALLWLGQEKK